MSNIFPGPLAKLAPPKPTPAPAAGQGVTLTDDLWVPVEAKHPGQEIAYKEFTSDVSVTATTEGGANTVVTAPAVEYDGKPIYIEFFTRAILRGTNHIIIYLFQDGSSLGWLASTLDVLDAPGVMARRLVPTKGLHTYSIRASVDAGTGTVTGGPGGSGNLVPGFLRITRAAGGNS